MKNKITIWTWGYRPFVMGGDVDYILKTEVAVLRRFKMRGFALACVEGPPNRFRCCECITGAIVTDGFDSADKACETAVKDIKAAKPRVMKQQIEQAKYHIKTRGNVTKPAAEFWAMLPGEKDLATS